MSRISFSLVLIVILSLTRLHANESESYQLIRQAYDDKLFLFVEEKALDYLSNPSFDQKGERSQKVYRCLISGLMEREAYLQALKYIKEFEQKYPEGSVVYSSIKLYKAWALFDFYIDREEVLPEEYKDINIAKMISDIYLDLEPNEKMVALYKKGQDFFYKEDYMSAVLAFGELTKNYPSFRDYEYALFFLGKSYYYLEVPLYKTALKTFEKLIEKRKRSHNLAAYYFWKGECLYEMGKLDEAQEVFQEALTHDPDVDTIVDIYYNLGWLASARGNLDEALQSFGELKKENLKEAAQRYQDSALYKTASILMLQKKFLESLETINPLLGDGPLKDEASLMAAESYLQLNRWQDAQKLLDKCRYSEKEEIALEASKKLGYVYYELKDYDAALEILHHLVEDEVPLEYRIEIKLQMAEVYYGKGDAYMAMDIYRDLMLEENKNLEPGLHYNLARCAMKTNPLIECFFLRDKYLKENVSEIEMKELNERSKRVLESLWILVGGAEINLTHNYIMTRFQELLSLDYEKRELEFVAKFRENNDNLIPKTINKNSDRFLYIKEEFMKQFTNKEIFPSYIECIDILGEMAIYYSSLRADIINFHLDQIINAGLETPFVALAHYEKAMLNKRRGLINHAVENLKFAIENTADAARKSRYLFNLAKTQHDQAKSIGRVSIAFSLGEKGVLEVAQKLKVVGGSGSHEFTFDKGTEPKDFVQKIKDYSYQTGVMARYDHNKSEVVLYSQDYRNKQQLSVYDMDGKSDLFIKETQFGGNGVKYTDIVSRSSEDGEGFVVVGERMLTIRDALKNISEVEKLGVMPARETYKLKYSCYRLIRENQDAEKVLIDFLNQVEREEDLSLAENDLISFYLELSLYKKAADQKIHYAEFVSNSDPSKAGRLRYEAAEIYLENQDSIGLAIEQLVALSKENPMTEWGFRASLKLVGIYVKKDQADLAETILNDLQEVKLASNLKGDLLMERDLAYGKFKLSQEDEEGAAQYFLKVMNSSKINSKNKADAYIEYGKLLKKKNPHKAAEVFLKFYYLFNNHPKRQLALYQCCRLKVMSLKGNDSNLEFKKREIELLISKLDNLRDKKSLLSRLEDI